MAISWITPSIFVLSIGLNLFPYMKTIVAILEIHNSSEYSLKIQTILPKQPHTLLWLLYNFYSDRAISGVCIGVHVHMFTGYSDSLWILKMGITQSSYGMNWIQVLFDNTKWTGLIQDRIYIADHCAWRRETFLLICDIRNYSVNT